MTADPSTEVSFDVSHDGPPAETLVVGFSEFGLAGLTAVEYLVEQLDLEQRGHVSTSDLPAITPFENGTPRHHTRLFGGDGLITVLVGELLIPIWAAGSFADSLHAWLDANGVEEVTILSGVPVAHGPDDHVAYFVASEDYQSNRLADADLHPMGRGFLEGVNAELIGHGIDAERHVGLLTTPTHDRVPDAEAAVRLLDAFTDIYDVSVDTGPLESFAADVEQHYAELTSRVARASDDVIPDDRMYM